MRYTIYVFEGMDASKDEPALFEGIFSGRVSFIREQVLHGYLLPVGINVIPGHDQLHIVEVGRRSTGPGGATYPAPQWNNNPGCVATSREVTADVVDAAQGVYILGHVCRHEGRAA